jgi:acetate---CoA ligase (ADP-forming) subunit beta
MTAVAPRMLLEPDAAKLLATYGIPYVRHGVATDPDAAVACANEIGYPVVLKVVSADVVHKTEVGGVLVGVRNDDALRVGYTRLLADVALAVPDADVSGVLVGEFITARRELIVGAIRDATLGPAVMVGFGGLFAEALGDVAFRLAPLSELDAYDMLRELRGAPLLTDFRGEAPIDMGELVRILIEVGRLVTDHPQISEVDLNPLAAAERGCVALDARVILE